MPRDKLVSENIFHVARIERCLVIQAIEFGIDLGIRDGLGHILDADDVTRLACHEIGDRSRAGVEIVYQLPAREAGEVAGHLIKFVGLLAVCLVEALRPHLEAQSLHRFVDKVGAGIRHHVQIADCVVALRVVHVEQRGDFGERFVQMLHYVERRALFLVVRDAKLHQQHDFARRSRAQHDVAHQAAVGAQVVEFQTPIDGISAQVVANAIVDFAHQVALIDVEYLVESAGNVEAEGIHLGEHLATFHLFERKPLLIGETKLEFVTILACFFGTQDGTARRQLNFADSREMVHHLLLFVAQLCLVGQDLPLASAAHAVVRAERFGTLLGIFVDVHGFRLGITVFLATDLQIHHIAGHHIGHKNGESVDLGQSLTFGSDIGDKYFFEQGKRFLLAGHSLFNFKSKSTILQRLDQVTSQKVVFLRPLSTILNTPTAAPCAPSHSAPAVLPHPAPHR